jgi:hypothetical protein
MYFIITALAAIVVSLIWYFKASGKKYKLSLLCFIYWGATIMWLIDHVVAYLSEGGAFLELSMDATLLGFAVVIFGLFIWLMALLFTDPKGIFQKLLKAKN